MLRPGRGAVKVVMYGQDGVGKQQLAERYVSNFYTEEYQPRQRKLQKSKVVDDKQVEFEIYPQFEKDYPLASHNLQHSDAILLVYDPTSRNSFDHLKEQLEAIKSYAKPGTPILLVATKKDVTHGVQVTPEEAQDFAKKEGLKFVEASAKTGLNVDNVFDQAAQMVIEIDSRLRQEQRQKMEAEFEAKFKRPNEVKAPPQQKTSTNIFTKIRKQFQSKPSDSPKIKNGKVFIDFLPGYEGAGVRASIKSFFEKRGYSVGDVTTKSSEAASHQYGKEIDLKGKDIKKIVKDFQDFHHFLGERHSGLEERVQKRLVEVGVTNYVPYKEAFDAEKRKAMSLLESHQTIHEDTRIKFNKLSNPETYKDLTHWKEMATVINQARMEVHKADKQQAKPTGIKGFITRSKPSPAESGLNKLLDQLVKDKRITSAELKEIKKSYAVQHVEKPKPEKSRNILRR